MSEEKSLVDKQFGETDLDLVWDGEKNCLKLTFGYDGKGVNAGVYVDIESDYFLDKLAKAIPGEVDDAVIGMLKAAF